MNTQAFLKQALQYGIRLSVHGDMLDVDAPRDALTPDVIDYMKQHKQEIISKLSEQEHGACVGCGKDTESMLTVPGEPWCWMCSACFDIRGTEQATVKPEQSLAA